MQDPNTALALLEQARTTLAEAVARNAAAIRAGRPAPVAAEALAHYEYAVVDLAEETYDGAIVVGGPHVSRLTFRATG